MKMENVTAILISFLREDYTIGCIESLRLSYPEIKIIVGENGKHNEKIAKVCKENNAEYIQLPFDSGVGYGRNRLMEKVKTKYVLVGDDDFYYNKSEKLDKMVELLDAVDDIDLIGGRVIENGIIRNYQGSIERNGRMLINKPIDVEKAKYNTTILRHIKTDLVFNFFIARTDKIRNIPWDEKIKVAYEHEDWFISLQNEKINVYFTPDCIVEHKAQHLKILVEQENEKHQEYKKYRNRRIDKEYFYKKHNLDWLIDMNGNRDDAPNSEGEKRRNHVKFVDFCITTFKRPDAIKRLTLSIAKYYPMANIYIADQNKTLDKEFYNNLKKDLYNAGLVKRIIIEHLPYDCGLSYARNYLVNTTPNQYKLILDDDMEFTKETDINKMLALFEVNKNAGVIGGLVKQLGSEMHYEFTPEIVGKTLYHRTERKVWKTAKGIKYRKTGCVLNFALFKKEVFNFIQWDEKQKISEHTDFYIRYKQLPYKIYYTPDVIIEHPPVQMKNEEYKEYRTRDEFQIKMMKKYDIIKIKYENGQVIELNDDMSLSHFREKPEEIEVFV